MIKKIKYGFEYKSINYGWLNKKLHRLPTFYNKKSLPFKELPLVDVGNKKGYRIGGDRKTINQLEELTEVINYTHVVNGKGSIDTPF